MKANSGAVMLMVVLGLMAADGAWAANITWTGSNGNAWNTSTVNWTGGATTYTDGDNVRFDETGASRTVNVAVAVSPGSIVVSNTASTPYMFTNNAIGGAGALTKDGAGTLTLATNNSYSGGTTLNNGTLVITHTNALGTGTLTLNGGVFDATGLKNGYHLTNALYVAGPVLVKVQPSGTAYWDGSLSGMSSGVLTLTNISLLYTPALGTIQAGFTLNAVNGTLSAGATTAAAATNLMVNLTNATLQCGDNSIHYIGGLAGDTASSLQNNLLASKPTFIVGGLNSNTVFDGMIQDGVSAGFPLTLIKVGTGTWTLRGITNSYRGLTTISNGFIAVSGSQALSTNAVILAGGGLAGASGGGTLSNVINMVSNANFNTASGDLTMISAVTNGGALTKIGAGTLTLSGANTYRGGTTVSNGTLLVNGSITGAVTVAGGVLGGTGAIAGSVTNSAFITAADTNSIGALTVTNLVMKDNSSYLWNCYSASSQDVINVTGTLTLPTSQAVTVTVSKVASGTIPAPAVLFNFGACNVSDGTTLTSWVINGGPGGARAKRSGNQIVMQSSGGMIIELY